MAWTAPTLRSTGDLITASIWNVDLKANLEYLKTEMDKAILKDGTVAFTANQPMGTKKLTGLGAGAAAGESVRYEQMNLVTLNDVTGARALDTIYQNLTGKIKVCVVSVDMDVDSSAGAGNSGALAQVENATPPTVQVDACKLQAKAALAADIESTGRVILIVPNNYYYRVVDDDGVRGVVTLSDWIEYDFH